MSEDWQREMIRQVSPQADDTLRKTVMAVLAAGCHNTITDLRVGVLNGIVHLAGQVDSMAQRQAAEELARQVCGIRGVVNRIEAPGAPSPARIIHLDLISGEEEKRNSL